MRQNECWNFLSGDGFPQNELFFGEDDCFNTSLWLDRGKHQQKLADLGIHCENHTFRARFSMGQTGWSTHQKTLYIPGFQGSGWLKHQQFVNRKRCVKSYWTNVGYIRIFYWWCLFWETWTCWCRSLNEGQWQRYIYILLYYIILYYILYYIIFYYIILY